MTYAPKYCDATSIYTKSGLSATEKDVSSNDSQLIQEAEAELEALTGRKFTSANSITEFFDGPKQDIVASGYQGYYTTGTGYGIVGSNATTIRVSFYPVLSITELKTLDTTGTATETYDTLSSAEIAAGTYQSADYWAEIQADPLTSAIICNGFIRMKVDSFPTGTQNIKVSYTYGYATVPIEVKNLATTLGAIRQWISFLGGSYNRLDTYSIPQQSVSKGDFFTRGTTMIATLTTEADRLLDRIGRRPRILFGATGQTR